MNFPRNIQRLSCTYDLTNTGICIPISPCLHGNVFAGICNVLVAFAPFLYTQMAKTIRKMDVFKDGFQSGSQPYRSHVNRWKQNQFRDKKMAVPDSKERSRTSSLEFRSPCVWLCSVVPPRRQSGQTPALSVATYRPCYLLV